MRGSKPAGFDNVMSKRRAHWVGFSALRPKWPLVLPPLRDTHHCFFGAFMFGTMKVELLANIFQPPWPLY